jgi:hypothetical protein
LISLRQHVHIRKQACQNGQLSSPAQPRRAETRLVPGKAAGESKPEAYPLGYVEDFDDPRTTLGTVFTSLLAEEGHDGETHQQIVDGVSQDTRQDTSGLFIDPSPKHSAPTDTQ